MNKKVKQINFDEAFELVKKGDIVHAITEVKNGYVIKILNKLPIERVIANKDTYLFVVIEEA